MPRLLLLPAMRLALMVLLLSTAAVRAESFASVQSLPSVAPAGSQFPHLFARGSQIYMSWLQQGEAGRASLWFSVLNDERWAPPQRIAEGDNWFVNWADFPALTVLADGTLAAYWLQKSAPDSYAYDIQLSFSTDLGRHWSAPIRPHDDNSHTEHGFVSLLPQADNSLSMVWLDGRESVSHHERMQLRHARFDSAGKKLSEQVIDSDTCTCCQTSAIALTRRTPPDSGPSILVAYRDHSAAEIRDIAVVRWQDARWSEPAMVHADNWEIPGCPVNGPALAQADGQAAVVWYTGAQQQPRVQLAFAGADGLHFGPPVRLDGGAAMGRVGLVMTDATTAIASWLERQGEQAVWWLRQVQPEPLPAGQSVAMPVPMAAKPVAQVSLARSSGFPRLALQGRHLVLAWTELTEGQPPQVRTARLPLSALQP